LRQSLALAEGGVEAADHGVAALFFYQYTLSFGEASFTVTEPTDVRFLDYFYQRCISKEEKKTKPLPTLRRKPPGLVRRFLHWMAQPI